MNESFELPVNYKGEELSFTSRLVQLGYTHRFVVDINGQDIAFEPDEEHNYRAILDSTSGDTNPTLNIELLKAIAHTIETVIR